MDLLYVTDHQHPAPREEARAAGQAAFHPEGELPEDYGERFALDHEHLVHLEDQGYSPFAAGDAADQNSTVVDHEHPPWTATWRGIETSLRRLAKTLHWGPHQFPAVAFPKPSTMRRSYSRWWHGLSIVLVRRGQPALAASVSPVVLEFYSSIVKRHGRCIYPYRPS